MRDIFFTAVFFGLALPALGRPWIALMMWVWMDYMNPHRLCFSFAKYAIPFSLIASALTFISIGVAPVQKRFPVTRESITLLLFVGWMGITTFFALNPAGAAQEWDRAYKIQLVVFCTLVIVYDRFKLDALIWTIAGSLAIYGIKGGLFTILNGGSNRVYGPEYTFIEDNNDLALALVTTIPLLRYLMLRSNKWWIRITLAVTILLTMASVIGTYSRGGLVGLIVTTSLMLLKSRKRLLLGTALLVVAPLVIQSMPQAWFDRMNTMRTNQKDSSMQGRYNAWQFGWNVVMDYPITGGGYRVFNKDMFRIYAPDPNDYHEAHNIFIKILAEQGFVGLGLFLLMAFFTWRSATWVQKRTKGVEELTWAQDLCSMVQVSMAAYAVGGAFLNLAYFGLPYHLMTMVVITKQIVGHQLAEMLAAQQERERTPIDEQPVFSH